jgi:adenylate cyclase
MALDLLRVLFGISPLDDSALARRRIAKRLTEIAPEADTDLPLVAEFLGVADPDAASLALPAKVRHDRLLDIVADLVRYDGASACVMIVENLHWVDEASGAFLAALADAVQGTRMLLVASYRPGVAATFVPGLVSRELILRDLEPADAELLVGDLLGPSTSLDEIRRRVVQRSGGNPFFAQELVRSLAENGLILGRAGAYVRGSGEGDPALPATAEAVIGARIDRLGDVEKAVLQLAAVIGQEAPQAVLAEVARLPADRFEPVLAVLSEAELVRERPEADVPSCTFCHPLVQEVAYGTLLAGRRRLLHASVARAMDLFYRGRSDQFAALVGYHYEAAEYRSRAAEQFARAARWIGRTNPAEAIKYWHKVRSLLQAESGTETDRLRMLANSQIAWLGWREGMTAEAARPFIEEAVVAARRVDPGMVPMLLFVEGRIIVASGGPADDYVQRVREALSLVDPDVNLGRAATLTIALCHALGWAGLLNEALLRNDEAAALLVRTDRSDDVFLGFDSRHWFESLRGRILLRLGRLDDARASFDAMLANADHVDPTVRFIPHFGYIELASHLDDLDLAEHHAVQVERLADEHGSAYLRVFATIGRAIIHGMRGDLRGAIDAFQSGLDLLRRASVAMEAEPDILAHLADCHLRNAAYGEAYRTAREAVALARHRSARVAECRALLLCGAALLAHGDARRSDQAKKLIQRAWDVIDVSGARLYAPLLEKEFLAAGLRLPAA